jgi:5-deoxy-glucuronate isomerase
MSNPLRIDVTPKTAGWEFSGLKVLDLRAGHRVTWHTGNDEVLVLPLSGNCEVTCDDERYTLSGRQSVFAGVTDFAYVPRDAEVTVHTGSGGRFAFPAARADRRLKFRYGAAADVPVEVLTPGGNWSSYPPHKHDEAGEHESALEEIYYFEVARGGPAYQRVYGHADRPIDICTEVRTGDVVLIPYGWHGPSMAAPGYDLYYLNVMAGPGERRWRVTDDPAHAWIRDTWADQAVDPRLPFSRRTL